MQVEQSILYLSRFFDKEHKEVGAWKASKLAKCWVESALEEKR